MQWPLSPHCRAWACSGLGALPICFNSCSSNHGSFFSLVQPCATSCLALKVVPMPLCPKCFIQPLFYEVRQFNSKEPVCYMRMVNNSLYMHWSCWRSGRVYHQVMHLRPVVVRRADGPKQRWWSFIMKKNCATDILPTINRKPSTVKLASAGWWCR